MFDELAEQALLGACFINRKASLIAAEYVDATDFYWPRHQSIFAAIMSLVGRGAEVDPVAVCSELGDTADRSYILSLTSLCPAATNVKEYAQSVRDASLDRRLRKDIDEATADLHGEALLLTLQDSLYRLDRRVERSTSMADVWAMIAANGDKPIAPGCEYPWQKIQWLTRGLRPGWFCVLAGETSHGKTAAALEIGEHAVRHGKRVAIISLEMGVEDIGLRIAQRRGLDSDRYYRGSMVADDRAALSGLVDDGYWSNMHVEAVEKVSQIGVVFRRWKPDLVILDHLQLLAGSEKVEELSRTTRQLKLMAERFQTPILCLSQLSRGEYQERGKLPRLSRLRGSGTIEQDADTVLFVWRRRDENEALTDESALVVAKSRMGRLGAVRTRFNGSAQTFTIIGEPAHGLCEVSQ